MTIIAIDPHITKNYAYSLWIDGVLEDFGYFDNVQLFNALVTDPELSDIKVLVEDQFLAKNYNTSKFLTRSSAKIEGVCELYGIQCEYINVAKWKGKIPELQRFDKDKSLNNYQRNKAKVGVLIEKAREVVNGTGLDVHLVDEDIASAVLIGYTMG